MPTLDIFRRDDEHLATLEPGAVIFGTGDTSDDRMFVVIEGAVEVRLGDTVLERVGPGGLVGEMALIEQLPRSASAVAVVATTVCVVDRKRFLYLVQNHPFFAIEVMQVLADRLRNMDARFQAIPPR